MKKTGCLTVVGVLFIAAVVLGLALIGPRNTMVAKDENVKKAWSEVENNLQRRNELIPQLVNTVKGVAGQEQRVFGDIANARSKLIGARSSGPSEDKMQASNDLSSALSRLLVISENYPELKSNQNFLGLQDEIASTENALRKARTDYNRAVEDYNKTARSFPMSAYVGILGFKKEVPYFEAPSAAREAPKVDFSDTTAPRP